MRFFQWIKSIIRGYFLAGLLVIVPLGAVIFVISAILRLMDRALGFIPQKFHPETYLPFKIPGLGLLLFIAVVLITGVLVKNYFGRRVVDVGEYMVSKIPLVRPLYGAVKQLILAIFGDTHDAFKRVVLVEYPRKGVYSLAFVTAQTSGEIKEHMGAKMLSIFLPTTPNPTSGFFLVLPEEDTIPLRMSVEDAFKLLISGGVVEPGEKNVSHFRFGRRQRNATHAERTVQGLKLEAEATTSTHSTRSTGSPGRSPGQAGQEGSPTSDAGQSRQGGEPEKSTDEG
jgi:uncharacterized membrane protein